MEAFRRSQDVKDKLSSVDSLPADLTLVSISGTGWTCSGNTCTRGDVLSPGSSYPAITVSVSVSPSAAAQVTNIVNVTGRVEASECDRPHDHYACGSQCTCATLAAVRATGVSLNLTLAWTATGASDTVPGLKGAQTVSC
jgi:hypothetical protein